MRQNILLAALSALTVATAQTQSFTINPDDVKPGDRGMSISCSITFYWGLN